MDQTQSFYNMHADEFEQKTRSLQNIEWINSFCELLPSKGHILDIGCAYGRDATTFVKKGFQTTGIDYSTTMIEKARKSVPEADFSVQDIREMKFTDQTFSGVWASAILLHVPKNDIPKILETIHRILTASGILFIGVYRGEGEGMITDARYADAQKYYAYFSEDELRQLLAQAGFTVLKLVSREPNSYESKTIIELLARKTEV